MSKQRICATATGLPKLTRRNFVTAAAATPLAALPVEASVESQGLSDYMRGHEDALQMVLEKIKSRVEKGDQSPIQKLFREWKSSLDYASSMGCISDEELNGLCDITREIEKKMLQQQVTSKEDLAAKILTDTGMGDFDLRPLMIEECRILMGV